jgi:hypothetical protein
MCPCAVCCPRAAGWAGLLWRCDADNCRHVTCKKIWVSSLLRCLQTVTVTLCEHSYSSSSFTSKRKGSNPDNRREVRISTSNENNFNHTVTEKVAKDVIASARFPENPWLVVGTSGSRVLTVHNQPNTDYSVQASVGDIRQKDSITILWHVHRHQSTSLILNYNSWQEQQR